MAEKAAEKEANKDREDGTSKKTSVVSRRLHVRAQFDTNCFHLFPFLSREIQFPTSLTASFVREKTVVVPS